MVIIGDIMLDEMKELKVKNQELTGNWSKLTNAYEALIDLEPILGKEKVKSLLKEIKLPRSQAEREVKKVRAKINKIQNNCQHGDWIYLGHDSHHDHEECGHCGWVDYRA